MIPHYLKYLSKYSVYPGHSNNLSICAESQYNVKIGPSNTPLKVADINKTRKTKRYKAVKTKLNSHYIFSVQIPMLLEGCKALINMSLYESVPN